MKKVIIFGSILIFAITLWFLFYRTGGIEQVYNDIPTTPSTPRKGVQFYTGDEGLAMAKIALEKNGILIDYENMVLLEFIRDELRNSQAATFRKYYNDIPYQEPITYHFDIDGHMSPDAMKVSGRGNADYSGPTDPSISLNEAGKIYRSVYRNQRSNLEARLYINNTKEDGSLLWHVTPVGAKYPYVEIDAISGKLIYYFDGVIVN